MSTTSPSISEPTTTAPSPTSVLFARGVIARLQIWPALCIAVHNNWGGPHSAQKRTWLASLIVDAFEEQHPSPDVQYIEELILQVLDDEFECNLEDGSIEGVARDVEKMWGDVTEGKDEMVKRFEETAERMGGKVPEYEEGVGSGSDWEDDSGESDEDEEDEAPQLVENRKRTPKEEPEVDEDGFTAIKRKARR